VVEIDAKTDISNTVEATFKTVHIRHPVIKQDQIEQMLREKQPNSFSPGPRSDDAAAIGAKAVSLRLPWRRASFRTGFCSKS
jgi:hypothetical protein